MGFEELVTSLGLYLATFLFCMVGGFIPIFNSEAFLLTISAISPLSVIIPVILLASAGQIVAKAVMFFAGRGVINLSVEKYKAKLEKVKQKFEKWQKTTNLFIFISASTGVPAFYLVSLLAGSLKLEFWKFCVIGFLGILVRFLVIFLFPQFIKGFMG